MLSFRLHLKPREVERASQIICRKLTAIVDDYKNIAIYYPIQNEVNVLQLATLEECKNCNFYLPSIEGDEMVFKKYNPAEPLQKSKFNIMQSRGSVFNGNFDAIIVPALAFDQQNNRIGYGKGFYDRYFAALNYNAVKIGICMKQFILPHPLPHLFSPQDVKMDMVISD